ncbi:hypothetical protein [Longispora albida]|uniref:hypothetical protein n=1 Tax=Longispora albida TaxID=203523 RepID=UPI00036096DA|nr:hypothetical protein [Longispora albida]
MDQFSKTVLPAAAESNIPSVTLTRHMPAFRRCVHPSDSVVLLAPCRRPEYSLTGDYLLLLTRTRLLVTRQSRLSGKVTLHLEAPISDLDDVVWRTNSSRSSVEFAAMIGDTRHRFWISRPRSRQLWRVDAQFSGLFRPVPVAA